MNKLNLVSNALITFYKMYYDDRDESFDLRPDQIPEMIIPALSRACRNNLVLRLALFLDMNNPEIDHVDAIIYAWDGVTATKKNYKLFGDGSYIIDHKSIDIL